MESKIEDDKPVSSKFRKEEELPLRVSKRIHDPHEFAEGLLKIRQALVIAEGIFIVQEEDMSFIFESTPQNLGEPKLLLRFSNLDLNILIAEKEMIGLETLSKRSIEKFLCFRGQPFSNSPLLPGNQRSIPFLVMYSDNSFAVVLFEKDTSRLRVSSYYIKITFPCVIPLSFPFVFVQTHNPATPSEVCYFVINTGSEEQHELAFFGRQIHKIHNVIQVSEEHVMVAYGSIASRVIVLSFLKNSSKPFSEINARDETFECFVSFNPKNAWLVCNFIQKVHVSDKDSYHYTIQNVISLKNPKTPNIVYSEQMTNRIFLLPDFDEFLFRVNEDSKTIQRLVLNTKMGSVYLLGTYSAEVQSSTFLLCNINTCHSLEQGLYSFTQVLNKGEVLLIENKISSDSDVLGLNAASSLLARFLPMKDDAQVAVVSRYSVDKIITKVAISKEKSDIGKKQVLGVSEQTHILAIDTVWDECINDVVFGVLTEKELVLESLKRRSPFSRIPTEVFKEKAKESLQKTQTPGSSDHHIVPIDPKPLVICLRFWTPISFIIGYGYRNQAGMLLICFFEVILDSKKQKSESITPSWTLPALEKVAIANFFQIDPLRKQLYLIGVDPSSFSDPHLFVYDLESRKLDQISRTKQLAVGDTHRILTSKSDGVIFAQGLKGVLIFEQKSGVSGNEWFERGELAAVFSLEEIILDVSWADETSESILFVLKDKTKQFLKLFSLRTQTWEAVIEYLQGFCFHGVLSQNLVLSCSIKERNLMDFHVVKTTKNQIQKGLLIENVMAPLNSTTLVRNDTVFLVDRSQTLPTLHEIVFSEVPKTDFSLL